MLVAGLGCAGNVEPSAGGPGSTAEPPSRVATTTPPAIATSAALPAPPAPPFTSPEPVDLWIRGGEVIDGSGAPKRKADVVVRAGKVIHVGEVAADQAARRVVDASGVVIAPGFVDAHSHFDPKGAVEGALAQGVTTIVVGQDGFSPAERIGDYLDGVLRARPRINVATLVGHHTVRSQAGAGARASLPEVTLAKMTGLVERAMSEGAVGLSTGLEYEPGRSASAAELAAIAGPVGAHRGVVMSHLRSEDDGAIDAATAELLSQCAASGARAHVAHVKIVHAKGAARADAYRAMLDEKRKAGVTITADYYPYTATYTTIGILFPDFARPPESYEIAQRSRRKDLLEHLRARVTSRGGPSATLFGTGKFAGRTLEAAARDEGKPFEEVLEALGPNGASAAYFVLDEDLQRRLFLDPWTMVGTDGGGGGPHPRGFGTFARIFAKHVREEKAVSVEEAVRKMTSLPAETIGFAREIGCVAPGCAADLVVFDPATVADRATFAEPRKLATGFRMVVVSGEVVREGDRATSARPGRVLRRRDPAPAGDQNGRPTKR